jgi:hypothetical protein
MQQQRHISTVVRSDKYIVSAGGYFVVKGMENTMDIFFKRKSRKLLPKVYENI